MKGDHVQSIGATSVVLNSHQVFPQSSYSDEREDVHSSFPKCILMLSREELRLKESLYSISLSLFIHSYPM